MRLNQEFFCQPADILAQKLLGKVLVRKRSEVESRYVIAETECYMGESDTACHAHKGKTPKTEVLWETGGTLYVHMIYGLHFMLNIVAGESGQPMGVLIRGVKDFPDQHPRLTIPAPKGIIGPGRVTRALEIGKDFNREKLMLSDRIWLEESEIAPTFKTAPRVGIDYAQPADRDRHWRFIATNL